MSAASPLAALEGPIRGLVLADPGVVEELGEMCRAALAGADPRLSPRLRAVLGGQDPVWVEARRGGALLVQQWGEGPDQATALLDALAAVRTQTTAEAPDALCVALTFDRQRVDMTDATARRRLVANMQRGIRGLELRHGEHVQRTSPLSMVATNRDAQKILDAFRNERRLSLTDLQGPAVEIHTFHAAQLWVAVGEDRPPVPRQAPLIRGKRHFRIEDVTRDAVVRLERDLGDFMCRSVQPDGRMLYMFYPSRGTEELKRNNMIRQWMATLSLCRLGHYRADPKVFALADLNIRYNLRKFYHASGKLGLIEWTPEKKVKLGAIALAVLSLFEHPDRRQFKRQEQRLRATIDHLWRDTGEFRTFFKPATRNDVQNFYPGEAQLCWAFLWRDEKDPALLDRFMRSFRYYRDWHFRPENRNPAFIPWHAQAYYNVWLETRDPELATFIFETSDWLLGVQQWDDLEYDDCKGRFHDPNRPFGPPHASSTGVYMEGLIDAFCLARTLGDEPRRESYRRALIRGLRSVHQLVFGDEIAMFYVRERELLRGGVPTTEYDNIVRIDNIQHNLMAILKILRAFEDADYRP